MNVETPPRDASQEAESADERGLNSGGSAEEGKPGGSGKKGRKQGRKGNKSALDRIPPLDDDPVGSATNTLGSLGNKALDKGGDQKDTLRLRLDLNLDVEIQLKARIRGDLELALLN